MHKKIVPFLLFFIILLTSGFGCKKPKQEIVNKMKPITLEYWRVWDGPDSFKDIIDEYQRHHPYIKINYRKLRYAEYEQALIEAFAADRGPDIFSLHNTWLRKYKKNGLVAPMPKTTSMVYQVSKGTIKKEVTQEIKTKKSLSLKDLKNNYVDVVYSDVVLNAENEKGIMEPQVFGLPMSVDNLVMFYNKNLFNNAGISNPPKYWNGDFQDSVKKLTKQNGKGEIVQSGVALGGSANIERSADILALLMMQNGTDMMKENGQVLFHTTPESSGNKRYLPALDALRFYTDFSNLGKEVYSWNKDMDNSIELFAKGKLGMMFGYSYQVPIIKSKAPKLNFGIAKFPQIEGNSQINIANYWTEVVAKNILTDPENLKQPGYAKNKYDAAWDFVQFAASKDQAKKYLDITKKPTALKSLIDSQVEDMDIGIFAEQVLTAKSWYKGYDANATDKIINELIDMTNQDYENMQEYLNLTATKVQQTAK